MGVSGVCSLRVETDQWFPEGKTQPQPRSPYSEFRSPTSALRGPTADFYKAGPENFSVGHTPRRAGEGGAD